MTTSRIKEKISAIVSSQLPEFIQSDFTTFVSFIEAYYRFLEQDQNALEVVQNARSYNDIDTTTDSFVEYFINTYAKNTPLNVLTDKRFLIKKINDLYTSKGGSLSFSLLFKILFNSDVSITTPYENVLIVSGGTWQQNFSIRVRTVSGNRNLLLNRIIRHNSSGVIFNTPILRSKILTSDLTELFLDPFLLSSSYSVGDLIEVYDGNQLIFTGFIEPTTTSASITTAGLGFKVGQIFNITAAGIGTIIKITAVTPSGGISKIKILSFGYDYQPQLPGSLGFSVGLNSDEDVSLRPFSSASRVGGFGSSGAILFYSGISPNRYFEEDYLDNLFYNITEVAVEFNNDAYFVSQDTTDIGGLPDNFAIVNFTLGALAKYPGSYTTDRSFISESEVRIQDDKLYQPFAYQTNTEIDISLFLDIVQKLLNPAGQIFFNNRTLSQEIDLSDELELDTDRKIFINAHDGIKSFDDFTSELNTFKDLASITDSEYAYNINKNLDLDLVDTPQDINEFNFTKHLEDSTEILSDVLGFEIQNEQQELVLISEASINSLSKSINNETEISDNGIVAVAASTYAEDYFSELYVIDPPITKTF